MSSVATLSAELLSSCRTRQLKAKTSPASTARIRTTDTPFREAMLQESDPASSSEIPSSWQGVSRGGWSAAEEAGEWGEGREGLGSGEFAGSAACGGAEWQRVDPSQSRSAEVK